MKKWVIVTGVLTVVLVPLLSILGMLLIFGGGGKSNAIACNPAATVSSPSPSGSTIQVRDASIDGVPVSAEQRALAEMFVAIGKHMTLTARDVQIGITTGLMESRLRNVRYGDRDSLGVLQQRPSQGWGTPEQIMNPVYAITKFYTVLASVPDRHNKAAMEVAISVQRPNRQAYERTWPSMEPIAQELLGTTSEPCLSDTGVPGLVLIAPGANTPELGIRPETMAFLARVAGIYAQPITVTTGTNHSYLTTSGNVSWHVSGNAADFGMSANGGVNDGVVGDKIAAACLIASGDSPEQASLLVAQGGLWNRQIGNLKIQCIWKTYLGGDHHDHVHIGAIPNA